MSQLVDIQMAQNRLEESFSKRMTELEPRLSFSGNSKEIVARVSKEFRAFRGLMFNMLGLLRKQINECTRMIDNMETRYPQNSLNFFGVPEAIKEDCNKTMPHIFSEKIYVTSSSATAWELHPRTIDAQC